MVATSTTTTTTTNRYEAGGCSGAQPYSSLSSSSSTFSSTSHACNGIDGVDYGRSAANGFVKRRHYNNNNNIKTDNNNNTDCGADVYSGYRKLCEVRMRRLERYKKARSFCSLEDENNINNNGDFDNKISGNNNSCRNNNNNKNTNNNCGNEGRFSRFLHHVGRLGDGSGSANPCAYCTANGGSGGDGGAEKQQPQRQTLLRASTSCSHLSHEDSFRWRDNNNNNLENNNNNIQPTYSSAELRARRSPVRDASDAVNERRSRRQSFLTDRHHVNIRPASESDSILVDLEESLPSEVLTTSSVGRSAFANHNDDDDDDNEWMRRRSNSGKAAAEERRGDSASSSQKASPTITPLPPPSPLNCQFEILREKMISMMENDVQLLRKLLTLGDTIQALRGTATSTSTAIVSAGYRRTKRPRRRPQNGGSVVSSEDDDRKTVDEDEEEEEEEKKEEEEEEEELDYRVDYFARPLNVRHRREQERPTEAQATLTHGVKDDCLGAEAEPYGVSKSDNSAPSTELSAAITRLYVDAAAGGATPETDNDEDVALEPNVQYFSRKNSVLRIPIPPRASNRRSGGSGGAPQPPASTAIMSKKIKSKLRYAPPPNHSSTTASSSSLASSASAVHARRRPSTADRHHILEEEEDVDVDVDEDDSGNSSASVTPPLAQCSPTASGDDSGSAAPPPHPPPSAGSPAVRLPLSEADSGEGSSRYSTVSSTTTSSSLDALLPSATSSLTRPLVAQR